MCQVYWHLSRSEEGARTPKVGAIVGCDASDTGAGKPTPYPSKNDCS